MDIVLLVGLGLLGLCMGSFAGAMVWRLRAHHLTEDAESRKEAGNREYSRLKHLATATFTDDRSQCLSCGHVLKWYDLLPLASWLSTGGKCRYCNKPIGAMEPLVELSTGLLFIVSYVAWTSGMTPWQSVAELIMWLIICVMFAILFCYDFRWYILPDRVIFPLIAVATVLASIRIVTAGEPWEVAIGVIAATVILSGLYWALWHISRGKWIGFGDVKLGLALALMLADWKLALLALFLANVIGCVIVIPAMLMGKAGRATRIPFGPLLIIGAVTAALGGEWFIDWYLSLAFYWSM